MLMTGEQVLIKRVRPEVGNQTNSSPATVYSARLALCIIFAFVLYTMICLVPDLSARWRQGVVGQQRTVARKTFVQRANYPTAAAWLSFRLHYYYAAISYLSDAIRQHPWDTRAYDR